MHEETCQGCGKTFHWCIQGATFPGGSEHEEVNCPHCGKLHHTEWTSASILVTE